MDIKRGAPLNYQCVLLLLYLVTPVLNGISPKQLNKSVNTYATWAKYYKENRGLLHSGKMVRVDYPEHMPIFME